MIFLKYIMLGLVLLVAGLLVLYLILTRTYWNSKGVYTAPGLLPGVGHYLEVLLLRKSPEWIHNEIYLKGKGHPAVGIYALNNPALVIRDLDLVKAVTISQFSCFTDQTLSYDSDLDFYMASNLFIMKGQQWKEMRHKISLGLTAKRTKDMFPAMVKTCQEFNSFIAKSIDKDIEMGKVSCFITCEMIAKCAFSVNGNSFDEINSKLYKAGRKLWDTTIYSPMFMMITYYLPFINKLINRRYIPTDVRQLFESIISQAITLRKLQPENDYLQHLISLLDKNTGFTFDDVVAQSFTVFFGGFGSSSMIISFAVYELALNTDVQEELRKEVQGVEFTYEKISSLPLLERVMQETLRMYPEFAILRTCTKDTVLQSGGYRYPVYKGQEVAIPTYAIHRNPEIYPDPDKFNPDRFLPKYREERHPMTQLGFGAGPRICVAKNVGVCHVKVTLANIVANFRVVRCGKTPERPRLRLDLLRPVCTEGLWVKFEPLNNNAL